MDFTHCAVDISREYGGSDRKWGILINDEPYMIKLSDNIPNDKRNELNSSYSNSAVSEHICCKIIKSMGISVQETILGSYTKLSSKGVERTYPAVACKNFVPEGYSLISFKAVENTVLDAKPAKIPKLSDVYYTLQRDNMFFSKNFGMEVAIPRFWDTFIVDSLLANFDRHANNWSYLVNPSTRDVKTAPIYDCGSCLYPQINDDGISKIINDPQKIAERIDVFPTAALLDDHGKKINYKEYINSLENTDCTEALKRVYPKIDLDKIYQIIDTVNISNLRKQFYKTMITARYEKILVPAYKRTQYICKESFRQSLVDALQSMNHTPGHDNLTVDNDLSER